MSTREQVNLLRVRVKQAPGSRDVPCPGCGLCTLLRGDDGLCEKCHALKPEVRAEWERSRREARDNPRPKPSKRLPPGTCIVCGERYGSDTIIQHDKKCPSRPEVCVCGKRYWTPQNLHEHQKMCARAQDR